MSQLIAIARAWYRPRRKAFAAATVPAVAVIANRFGIPAELAVLATIAITPALVYRVPNDPTT